MRITIACPDALRDDANQLAMVLGYGRGDAQTYVDLNWQDADGNLYACASLPVSDTFTSAAQTARMGRRQHRKHGGGWTRTSGAGVLACACVGLA